MPELPEELRLDSVEFQWEWPALGARSVRRGDEYGGSFVDGLVDAAQEQRRGFWVHINGRPDDIWIHIPEHVILERHFAPAPAHCSQCGNLLEPPCCGPTHAVLWAEAEARKPKRGRGRKKKR